MTKVNKKDILVVFKISEQEKVRLDQCLSESGNSKAEFFRRLLENEYTKKFPVYVSSKRKEKSLFKEILTPEQKCERAGGKVVVKEGIDSCKVPLNTDGSMFAYYPLSKIDDFI